MIKISGWIRIMDRNKEMESLMKHRCFWVSNTSYLEEVGQELCNNSRAFAFTLLTWIQSPENYMVLWTHQKKKKKK